MKAKGKGQKGKGYGRGIKMYKGKTAIGQTPIHSGKRGYQEQQSSKVKWRSKSKSKSAANICHRCRQEGGYVEDCKVALYNLNDAHGSSTSNNSLVDR